jgi:hypothetical protein
MVSLKSSILFSQKAILNNNDTLICFTPEQCKVILKEFSRAKYLDTLVKVQSNEITILNLTINDLQELTSLKSSQLKLSQDLSKLKDVQIERLIMQKKEIEIEVKRQKRLKVFSIIAGSVSTGVLGYLWITKN